MVYVRGNKRDFDIWEEQGCRGWSYKDVLPYFIKSEDCRIPELANNGYHGTGGGLTVSWPSFETELKSRFFEALLLMGYKEVDYNGEQQTGFGKCQFVIRDGKRCSSAKAFLQAASGRANLNIVTGAFVTKIEFDEHKVAKFVMFEHKNNTYKVAVEKEVIVSGGAVNSPQLLMLSGIGPKNHLEELGIPVIVDLQGVGQNLHDHIGSFGTSSFTIKKPFGFLDMNRNYEELLRSFETDSPCPLSVPYGIETLAFVHSKFSDEADVPDVELVMMSVPFIPPYGNDEVVQKMSVLKSNYGFTLVPTLQRPRSRGFIKLRSSDPHDHPIIDPRYLTVEEDEDILADGLRIIKEIAESPPFKDLGAEVVLDTVPGCENYELWSEKYRKCIVRTLTMTNYHPVGTCKMGDVNDETTVVDHKLRVKGVKGLRVADASIMPNVVSANTNAACIMIGEKAADLIKESLHTR